MTMRTFSTREEWLAARRETIGGSDAPVILGLSRWKTPLGLYAEKRGLIPRDDPTEAQRIGHRIENLILDLMDEEIGADGSLSVHGEHLVIDAHATESGLTYSPDGFVRQDDDGPIVALAEAKNRGEWSSSEWDEGVPPDVFAQVQHGMEVCDLPAAYVGALLGGNRFRWAKVERDRAWYAAAKPTLMDFLRRVRDGDPPAPVAGDKGTLGALYPTPQDGKTVALPPDFLDVAWRLDEIDAGIKFAEEEREALQNRVRAAIGEAERGVLVDGSWWTWTKQSRPKMVADRTQPPSEFRVLRRGGVKKAKKEG